MCRGNDLLAGVEVYLRAWNVSLWVRCVYCVADGYEVFLYGGGVRIRDGVHFFFPLCY